MSPRSVAPNQIEAFLSKTDGMLVADTFPESIPTGNGSYTIAAWIQAEETGARGIVGWGGYGSARSVNALRTFNDNGFRHYWWAADLDAQERDWWRHLVRQVTNRAGGIKAFDAYFDRLYAYFAQPNAWVLYDEVLPLLQTLRARGISSAVVSNFDSRLLPILQGLGVSELVGGVVYSTAANSAKPDAGIFRQATALLDLPAAHCLHLGDHPIADYQGARAAGLQALLVHRGAPDQMPATDCITNLSEALARFQN